MTGVGSHICSKGCRCERASMAEKRKLVVANTCGSEAPSGHGKRILVRRRTPIGPEPPQCVTGADTLAGACLEAVARRVVYVGIQKHGRPIGAKTFKVAGGSSIVSVALEALENEFSFQGVEVDFEYPFIVCDSDKANRTENVRWCMSVQDTMDGKTGCMPCIFEDIVQISSGSGWCARHQSRCGVHWTDGAIYSISGKDFSREKLASSGSTSPCSAFIQVIDKQLPDWLILENRDAVDNGLDSPGLAVIRSELSSRGYDIQPILMDALEYGLPQVCKRMFVLAVMRPARKIKIKSYDRFFRKVLTMLDQFKTAAPDLRQCILPQDDDLVAKHLEEPGNLHEESSKTWDVHSKQMHRIEWRKHGVRVQNEPQSELDKSSAWYRFLSARQRDVLSFHQHACRGDDEEHIVSRFGTDLNTNIQKISHTSLGDSGKVASSTLHTGSRIWLSADASFMGAVAEAGAVDTRRLLLGCEALTLQGWPILSQRWQHLLERHSDLFMGKLAGMVPVATIILVLVAAVLLAVDENEDEESATVETDSVACDNAIALLASVQGPGEDLD